MDSLCFFFECLSLSEKRKRSSYKDEDLFYNGPKRIRWITSLYELNAVGQQNRPIGEKIRPEKSKKLPKMDAGVSQQTRQLDGQPVSKKKSLVVNSSDRGQIVNLGPKPKVLTVEDVEHLVKCLNDRFV
ncbi:hypothetical protein DAPPUDRAFT_114422 [Daphnia pulex]|uniref:Uncharacterized protein n=1 Tax=Daphnia pulex TaxID=6669 RepID=E9HI35_DAPPU|nr:hypothetical protein DAPPUDRAFT_114422 [Daphnia pulex]|eukprot:EFX68609.1 hypothetical protein DAPPUDRAFT_114422 [Daphnia pulex]